MIIKYIGTLTLEKKKCIKLKKNKNLFDKIRLKEINFDLNETGFLFPRIFACKSYVATVNPLTIAKQIISTTIHNGLNSEQNSHKILSAISLGKETISQY